MSEQITMFGVEPMEDPDSNEWYTPGHVVELARDLMRKIDLDPASCEQANQVVQAEAFYTKKQNGLSLPWAGRVWLNPPYAKGDIDAFVNKLCWELSMHGDTVEACVLVNNATDTGWFHRLLKEPSFVGLCLLRGRLRFWGPLPTDQTPRNGQVVLYFCRIARTRAEKRARFHQIFSELGVVL